MIQADDSRPTCCLAALISVGNPPPEITLNIINKKSLEAEEKQNRPLFNSLTFVF